ARPRRLAGDAGNLRTWCHRGPRARHQTSGVRVRVSADLPVGAAVTLRITLPRGANRLEVVARVARREADGLALDFIGMPETEARRVEPLGGGWGGGAGRFFHGGPRGPGPPGWSRWWVAGTRADVARARRGPCR